MKQPDITILTRIENPGGALCRALNRVNASDEVLDAVESWSGSDEFHDLLERIDLGADFDGLVSSIRWHAGESPPGLAGVLADALETLENERQAPIENDDEKPAIYTLIRWTGVAFALVMLFFFSYWFVAVRPGSSDMVGVFLAGALMGLPAAAAIMVRRSRVGFYIGVIFVTMTCATIFFMPLAAFLLVLLMQPDIRRWFDGHPLPPRAARIGTPAVVGYALLISVGCCSGLIFADERANERFDGMRFENDAGDPLYVEIQDHYQGDFRRQISRAPEVELTGYTLDGDPWVLPASEEPRVVYAWATWDPDSAEQLEELPLKYQNLEVYLWAGDCWNDEGDNRAAVRRMAREKEVEYPVVCGDESWPVGFDWWPSVMVVDPSNRLRFFHEGEIKRSRIGSVVDALE